MPHYNYADTGAYFVTICAHDRKCLFGSINAETMQPNQAGEMLEEWWIELSKKFPEIGLDEYVVMPNHFHGIVIIGEELAEDLRGRRSERDEKGRPHRGAPTLGAILGWFKAMTTNAYIQGIKERDWPPFSQKLWQRSYYDRVIRNDDELSLIRQYIISNPAKWELDHENPGFIPKKRKTATELDMILKGEG